MFAVVVDVPYTHWLATTPSAVFRSVGGTPLTNAPLLFGWDETEVFLDNPLVEVGHFLMLGFGQLFSLDRWPPSVRTAHITHVHLAHAYKFT